MHNPNFTQIADAYGIPSRAISRKEELTEALNEMLNAKTSWLLEVVVGQEDNVFPMIPAGAGVADMLLELPNAN
jgi:acetolactate synthase-1/2/3 large subunit